MTSITGRPAGRGLPRNPQALERAAQTASSEALTVMEQRMTWLATIAAIAPFIGLFGTVMGIIDAFHGLGTAGAATLRAVAPGISEALITTAAGLVVAIPAVVGYNQLTARLREFGARMDDFGRELLNAIENAAMLAPPPQQVPEEPRRRSVLGDGVFKQRTDADGAGGDQHYAAGGCGAGAAADLYADGAGAAVGRGGGDPEDAHGEPADRRADGRDDR